MRVPRAVKRINPRGHVERVSEPKEPDDLDARISGWHSSLGWGERTESVAPYVPSPINVVRKMLALADAGPGDIVYDLGCGDGRILFTAVEEFDVEQAVGYDLNQHMVDTVERKAKDKGLDDRIWVYNQNFFEAEFREATIITLYLTTSGNAKLMPKFEHELKSGARVVSHDFPVHGWETAKQDGGYYILGSHKIYLYNVPAAFENSERKVKSPHEKSDRWKSVRDLMERLDRG